MTLRARALAALRIVGLVVLVGIVLRRVDFAAVGASWRGMGALTIGLTLSCFCGAMAVRVAKWTLQVRSLGLATEPVAQARAFLWGILLGVVTPMRLGELGRLSALSLDPERRGDGLRLGAAALLLEKGYELLVLLSLAIGGCVVVLGQPALAAALTLPLMAGAAFGLLPLSPPAALLARLPASIRKNAVDPVLLARDGMSWRARLAVFGLTGLAQLLNMIGGLQLYRAFGDIDLWTCFLGMPLLTFTSAVPITVSGIGLREVLAMELFGRGGYPAHGAAVAATLTYLGANVVPTLALLPLELAGRRAGR